MQEVSKGGGYVVDSNRCSWDSSYTESMGALITRRMIRTPAVTILRIEFKKGANVPTHHHMHEQVTMVESGSLRLEIDGQDVLLAAGDVIRIAPDVPHYTEALADSTTVEIFSPAREDVPCPAYAFLNDPETA